jgi:peptide/nickel transport system permease protein
MWRYLIRRVLWAFVLFIAVTLVTFVIFFVVPVNPAALAAGRTATAEDIERVEKALGLDRPLPIQYAKYVHRLSPITCCDGTLGVFKRPDLGTSFASSIRVNDVVQQAAPVTASLVFGGVVFWMLLAIPIGVLSALRPRSLLDRAAMVFVLIGISAHPVWIGLILAYFIGFKLELTPITGYADFFNPSPGAQGGPIAWAHHMLLPWATFMLLFAAQYVRMIRANVMEVMNEDYVRTARAKGAPESIVMRSHILRNAMLAVVTMLGMDIGLALGGAIFTETVFGLPGLGQTAILAVLQFDLPIVLGVVVFGTVAIIVFTLLVDILYAFIDPRIRLA